MPFSGCWVADLGWNTVSLTPFWPSFLYTNAITSQFPLNVPKLMK